MVLPVYYTNADTADTAVYTAPPTVRIVGLILNISALLANTVRVATTSGAAPAAENWLEPGQVLTEGVVLERTGVYLPAGHTVWIGSDTANAVSVQIFGIEEAE